MMIQCPVCKTEVEYKHLLGSDIYLIHLKELLGNLFEWAEDNDYEIECEEWHLCLKEYLPRLQPCDRLALVSYYTFAGWLDEEGETKFELYLF